MRRRRITRVCIALAGSVLFASPLAADNWPQWRGPEFDGSVTEKGLPEALDPKANQAWSTALPGASSGTPVVWGDRVFVGALDRNTKKLLALCVDRGDGKVLWQKEIAINYDTNQRNDLASPSPITDGKTVWFYYGTGDLAAFDFDGKPLWARNIQKDYGKFNVQWIYSSSPLLYKGKMYVPVLHRDGPALLGGGGGGKRGPGGPGGPPGGRGPGGPPPAPPAEDPAASAPKPAAGRLDSYILCVDPATGKDIWQVTRPTDAVQESREAYTTPIPMEVNGKTQILIMGGDYLTGHDAETGKELWRFGSYNPEKIGHWRTVTSAVAGAGLVFCSPPKNGTHGESFYAVKPGDGTEPAKLAWKSGDVTTDVCVPLFYQNQLYVLNGDRFTLTCLDPATGEKKWSTDLGRGKVFRASPLGADGKIYCMNEGADVTVVSAADGKVLSKQSLGTDAPTRSSIVAAEGEVFVRTGDHLYAFKK
jgi:outer membrane protein assembly factor BamB